MSPASGAAQALVTRVTKDTGATIKPGPMITAHPDQVVTDDAPALASFASEGDTGLNGPFVADLLSSCLAHENMGKNLFQMLGQTTANPALQAQYAHFRGDALTAVETYKTLITALGGNPHYASPAGRMTEGLDQKMIESFAAGGGSADPLTLDLKGVEAVLLASTMCVANTMLLSSLAEGLDEGSPVRTAMETAAAALLPVQEGHLSWAASMQRSMVLTQARSRFAQGAAAAVEGVAAKVKDALT
jgi:hypothetical protein